MTPNLALGRLMRTRPPDTLHKEIKPQITSVHKTESYNGKDLVEFIMMKNNIEFKYLKIFSFEVLKLN